MKGPFERTKVVIRRLPPAMSQAALMEQIDARFAGRYKWAYFRPGKASQMNQRCSRAYIDFKKPEDVVEFSEFFNGHMFVNEKGTQFKALVEYAPSQLVSKTWSKKDGREGTIFKDPDYLEFLAFLAKPVEHLPSAEIQLERREAERAPGAKEQIVVTPLMDFVRLKRAARSESQRSSANGRLSRRVGGSMHSSSSPSSKRASDKRRFHTSMYVLRDGSKNGSGKDKGAYILVSRREEQQSLEKPVFVASVSGTETLADESVAGLNGAISVPESAETGKRRIVLLKGKEKEGSNSPSTSARKSTGSSASKQGQKPDASGRIIRSILSNKDARQNQSPLAGSLSEQKAQMEVLERDKRPPRPPIARLSHFPSISSPGSVSNGDGKRVPEDNVSIDDLHGSVTVSEKHDRRMRSKNKPDRGVWTPSRSSDGAHATDDTLSSSLPANLLDSLEAVSVTPQVKVGNDDMSIHGAHVGRGTKSLAVYEVPLGLGDTKGSQKHVGRRGSTHGLKELDGSLPSKRGVVTGYGSHERQIWVQKSGSGS